MRGRIRTVKPELFSDEELWDLGAETGLPVMQAFVGLWCYADREGRFEWRPRALKAAVLPFWDGDMSRVLDALASRAFIVRYVCAGRDLGVVRTFSDHQIVNHREAQSELGAPPQELLVKATELTRAPRVPHACPSPPGHASGEGKGTEGNGREGWGKESEETAAPSAPLVPAGDALPIVRDVFDEWRKVHNHPTAKLDPKRTARIRGALKLNPPETLKQAIRGALKDDWLMGRDPKSPRKYDGLETILRDAAQIERLADVESGKAKANATIGKGNRIHQPNHGKTGWESTT